MTNEIQNTLNQMGGAGRLAAMIGARLSYDNSRQLLSIRFKGCRKMNHCNITLDASDTYTVEFFKVGKWDAKEIDSVSFVYADQLQRLFESRTGLYLSI